LLFFNRRFVHLSRNNHTLSFIFFILHFPLLCIFLIFSLEFHSRSLHFRTVSVSASNKISHPLSYLLKTWFVRKLFSIKNQKTCNLCQEYLRIQFLPKIQQTSPLQGPKFIMFFIFKTYHTNNHTLWAKWTVFLIVSAVIVSTAIVKYCDCKYCGCKYSDC
jgi:hypothetical protein